MEINEINKKLYEDAFISTGEYGDLNSWKPSIDEREIHEIEVNENDQYVPSTPLGYRDYTKSRIEGIGNILKQENTIKLNEDEFRHIKRGDNVIKLYDKVTLNNRDFVIVGDDEEKYYVVNKNNELFYINYE